MSYPYPTHDEFPGYIPTIYTREELTPDGLFNLILQRFDARNEWNEPQQVWCEIQRIEVPAAPAPAP